MNFWTFNFLNFWVLEFLKFWIFGIFKIWIFDFLNFDFLNFWIFFWIFYKNLTIFLNLNKLFSSCISFPAKTSSKRKPPSTMASAFPIGNLFFVSSSHGFASAECSSKESKAQGNLAIFSQSSLTSSCLFY